MFRASRLLIVFCVLADPDKFIPGNRMGFKTRNAADRADLIAYLKTRG